MLAKRDDGDEGAQERRSREISAGSCCAQIAKRANIKRETQAVSNEPGTDRQKQSRGPWNRGPDVKSKQDVHRTRHQPFQFGDLQWIGE